MKREKKFITFDIVFWVLLLFSLILMVLICLLPKLLTKPGEIDFRETGQIGDTIGGIMSPFVAMIATLLTFLAFWVQYKANKQQREDIAKERFERNVFEMLNAQEQIISGLVLEDLITKMKQTGRDVFQMIYEDAPLKVGSKQPLKDYLANDKDMRKNMKKEKNIWFLDHYFRHLYRIYKYIDEYDEEIITADMKKEYAEIVRSHLSPYELVMLFYNSFSYDKSMNLIVKYNVLENIRKHLLATKEDEDKVEEMIRKI